MNVLDENILSKQRRQLLDWRIRVRQIGIEIGRKGLTDEEIRPLLARLRQVTFFTRDAGYYRRRFCHPAYCLAVLDVREAEIASYVRRLIRHPDFDTQRKRLGSVIRASSAGITLWRLHAEREETVSWPG